MDAEEAPGVSCTELIWPLESDLLKKKSWSVLSKFFEASDLVGDNTSSGVKSVLLVSVTL